MNTRSFFLKIAVIMALEINPVKCTQDHVCLMLKFCPAFAISQSGTRLPNIDSNKCFECRNCTYYCPNGAVELKIKEVKTLIK